MKQKNTIHSENENFLIIIAIIVLLLIFGWFGMMNFSYRTNGMMSWMFGAGFGFMGIFGWLFMTLVLIALIILIVWMIKQMQSRI